MMGRISGKRWPGRVIRSGEYGAKKGGKNEIDQKRQRVRRSRIPIVFVDILEPS